MFVIILATLAIAILLTKVLFSHRQTIAAPAIPTPPVVPGPPILGSALPLGKQGADFIYKCWKRYGDAFTLHVVGQRMTFLFCPEVFAPYFRSPETQLAFLPAVEQWTQRVFGLPPSDFIPRHGNILTTMRHLVSGREKLSEHAEMLAPLLERGIASWVSESDANKWKEIDLVEAIVRLVFAASVEALFGFKFLERHGVENLRETFFKFESWFELAASPVPHLLLPQFRAARSKIIAAFRESYSNGDFSGTTVGDLITSSEMPARSVPNMLLAVLWASQANTVPTAFWTVGFLLLPENKIYFNDLRNAILLRDPNQTTQEIESSEPCDNISHSGCDDFLSSDQLNRLISLACDPTSLLTRCCMESLRLRSSSTDVRIAATDILLPCSTKQQLDSDPSLDPGITTNEAPPSPLESTDILLNSTSVLIKKGTMVMICPWISHIDPRLYENPMAFDPGREGAALPSGKGMHSSAAGVGGIAGVAFGGGKFRCPGRSFAEMELGVTVGLILAGLEVEIGRKEENERRGESTLKAAPGDPHGLLPLPDVTKLVGIKVPKGPCWVKVRRRRDGA